MSGRRIYFYDEHNAQCSSCKAIKPRAEFNVDRGEVRGVHRWCKPCCDVNYGRVQRRTLAELRHAANVEAFWNNTERPDGDAGCWLWKGRLNESGYGKGPELRTGENTTHRTAFALKHGPIPAGLWVLHSCDVRRCISPAHLRLGNNADNVADMVERKRQGIGARNPAAKLNDEHVRAIRAGINAGDSDATLAKRFEVSRGVIWNIRVGKTWTHVV